MGRKSLAKKLYEEVEVDETPGHNWLVVYDFLGMKPSPNFWSNLQGSPGIQQYCPASPGKEIFNFPGHLELDGMNDILFIKRKGIMKCRMLNVSCFILYGAMFAII